MSLAAYRKSILVKATASTAYVELPATSATLTLAGDVLDDTDMTSTGYRSHLVGLRDWSISAPSNYESTNAGFTAAKNAWTNRTKLDVRYLPNGSVGFQGQAYVETFTLSGDVGGLESVDISMVSAGALSTV